MIDIHCHILPGLDDGSSSIEESVEMAEQAWEQGITDIIATPHVILDADNAPTREAILKKVQLINGELEDRSISVRIHSGAELFVDSLIPSLFDKSEVSTLADGGKYVMMELPLGGIPLYLQSIIFGLTTRGVTPVIAHPERNWQVSEDPNILLNLIHKGCLAQANAGSFSGVFGSRTIKTVRILLEHNMLHFIGSDAHNCTSRKINFSEIEVPTYLLNTNPKKILLGQSIEIEEPIRYKKRRFFGLFVK
jgi:protein-tyrosine phosphatase